MSDADKSVSSRTPADTSCPVLPLPRPGWHIRVLLSLLSSEFWQTSHWALEAGHGHSVNAMEVSRCHPESPLLMGRILRMSKLLNPQLFI